MSKYRVFNIEYDTSDTDMDAMEGCSLPSEMIVDIDIDELLNEVDEYNLHIQGGSESGPKYGLAGDDFLTIEDVLSDKVCDKISDITNFCVNNLEYEEIK